MSLFPSDESDVPLAESGVLIGMDEAGYGPNLGPLVVAASVWKVPGEPAKCDLWELLTAGVSRKRSSGDQLLIGDSKVVYQPGKGLATLERTVLSLLATTGIRPQSFHELCQHVAIPVADDGGNGSNFTDAGPWLRDVDLPLPFANDITQIKRGADCFSQAASAVGVTFESLYSDVVSEPRFNRLVSTYASKGEGLSRTAMAILHHAWPKSHDTRILVIGDKHGGRNRYAPLLCETFDGCLPQIIEEGTPISRYRFGHAEVRFRSKGEQEFPVAVASMLAKYLRELAMECFNRYWCERVPGLEPTAGYPLDAQRYYAAIRDICDAEEIDPNTIWRCR